MLCLIPIPFYDKYIHISMKTNTEVVYFFNEFMIAAMSLRTFFILRTMINY